MITRLQWLRLNRALWPLPVVFMALVLIVCVPFWFFWEYVGGPVDQKVDHFIGGRFFNKSFWLLVFMFLATAVFVAVPLNYFLFFWFPEYRNQNQWFHYFQLFLVISGPILFLASLGVMESSSFHLGRNISDTLDEMFD